jgi:hypothetical protein
VIRNDVIFEKSLQVLLTPLAKQKSIDLRTKFLESKVRWCEEGTTDVV